MEKSNTYYQNNFAGNLANKLNDLTNAIPELIHSVMDQFVPKALALIIGIYTLSQANIVFGIVMACWVTLFIGSSFMAAKYLVPLADKWSDSKSQITGKVVDMLSNILSVLLFERRKFELKNLNKSLDNAVQAETKLQYVYFAIWCAYGILLIVVQAINFYFLIKGLEEGWVTVGDFALIITLNISITNFLWDFTYDLAVFYKAPGQATQGLRAIFADVEIQDAKNATILEVARGDIEFKDVTFHYKGTNSLFQNKSIHIKSGEKVGLVGYSGSGKTTFVNLILRLYDIKSGEILIDGQNIRTVTQDSLRANVTMIPQDPALFHRSLKDNIRYGKPDATDEQVIEAAKRANAHEFIMKLEEQYDSLVGERGVKISGGQRQRIAIARAFLKNSPILVMDEATSQLDSLTENYIQESLWELMQGKTTLVIAHRLSTLKKMDRILVFRNGHIIEDGTHKELLKKGKAYKKLWDAQVGGFLPDEV